MEIHLTGICWINTAMNQRSFISFLLLIPFPVLKAQDENRVFEKVEVNASTNQKQWNDHLTGKTQLADSVMKDIPAGTYKVNVLFVVDIHENIGQVKAKNDDMD